MTPTAVSQALRQLVVEEKQPVFIWGSPGTGKSGVGNFKKAGSLLGNSSPHRYRSVNGRQIPLAPASVGPYGQFRAQERAFHSPRSEAGASCLLPDTMKEALEPREPKSLAKLSGRRNRSAANSCCELNVS